MIFRSPLFRKLLLTGFLLILVTLAAVDVLLTRYTAGRELDHVRQELALAARVLGPQLATLSPADLENWVAGAQQRSQARITIIDGTGTVLADSQHPAATMENHGQRPEVREALAGRRGTAVRHSATLGVDFCYLAMPFPYQGRPAVLRLAFPLREVQVAIVEVRWRILEASLLAALLALLVAYAFSRALARRIRRLQDFARQLVNARLSGALPPEPEDELGGLAGSLRDMAAQLREMVDQISLESARRQAILTSMVEGVLAVDNELRVTFCNESFARAVGARTPVADHLPVLEVVRDPGFLELLSRVIVTQESVKKRMQLTSADGRWFEVQAAPLVVGSRRGAIAILHDITDLERLERIRKDFVANVSHELRTPLTAIRGYAETLLDGALEDEQNNRKFLEVIRAHAIRLNNISSDLLVLSELDSQQPGAAPEPVGIRAALEAATRTVESEARVRNVTLHIGRLDDAAVMGHRIRMEQALVNLLDNAVKFNRPGGEVSVESALTEDGRIRLRISDTGIGIPSADLPRIFERFYRVDKARSRDVGGTGLGLSIVKHVVERMNGTIAVDSQLGKGSTFTLLFPVVGTPGDESDA